MIVRAATYEDIPDIIAVGRGFHAELQYAYPPLDEDLARQRLGIMVHLPQRCMVLVVRAEGGALAGFILAGANERVFHPGVVARHDMLYVVPRYRGSRAAWLLIEGFRLWAREIGAKELVISEESGIDPDRTRRFYRHIGLVPFGQQYREVV